MNLKLLFFHSLLWYCHMKSEIIQIVAFDSYDGFQQLSIIFSQRFVSIFWRWFNGEIELRFVSLFWRWFDDEIEQRFVSLFWRLFNDEIDLRVKNNDEIDLRVKNNDEIELRIKYFSRIFVCNQSDDRP